MAPRGRPRKNVVVGTRRMDAALDAMRQLGFEKRLIRQTVQELLDVYDGTQGWPFIEDGAYKLLIETLLEKQQNSPQDKEDTLEDNEGRHDVAETSRATEVGSSDMVAQEALLPTAKITEIGSSNLVAQDSLLHTNDGLDSASQTNEQDSASHGNLETDVTDILVPADGGNDEQCIRVEPKTEPKLVDDVIGSSHSKFARNVERTVVRDSGIESSKKLNNLPRPRRKPSNGWVVSDDDDDDVTDPVPADGGSNEQGIRMESKTEQKRVDDVKGSGHSKFASNIESTVGRDSGIESSKRLDNVPRPRRKPLHGWIDDSDDEDERLVYFALPALHKQVEMMAKWAPNSSEMRKSRWDEKPDGM